MPAHDRETEQAAKTKDCAKLPVAVQPKKGWLPAGKAYEGRKRPDGLNEEWC